MLDCETGAISLRVSPLLNTFHESLEGRMAYCTSDGGQALDYLCKMKKRGAITTTGTILILLVQIKVFVKTFLMAFYTC